MGFTVGLTASFYSSGNLFPLPKNRFTATINKIGCALTHFTRLALDEIAAFIGSPLQQRSGFFT